MVIATCCEEDGGIADEITWSEKEKHQLVHSQDHEPLDEFLAEAERRRPNQERTRVQGLVWL